MIIGLILKSPKKLFPVFQKVGTTHVEPLIVIEGRDICLMFWIFLEKSLNAIDYASEQVSLLAVNSPYQLLIP